MLYSWGLVPEIGITDFRDSHKNHTDTSRLCREIVHLRSLDTANFSHIARGSEMRLN